MRAPSFWWQEKPGFLSRSLLPVSAVYGHVAGHRLHGHSERLDAPVFCIGNVVAGGAGKTPTAIAIAQILRREGERPAILSRGYGGSMSKKTGAHFVLAQDSASDVGDEPLLLARAAPTIVGRDRVLSGRLALECDASVLIMDDGLQNPALHRDFKLAVFDGGVGVGNRQVIPSGPLRAPLDQQLALIDAALIIGDGAPGDRAARYMSAAGKPCFRGRLAADANVALRLIGARVVAFAGIGRPEKFYESLQRCGAKIVARHDFADHRFYKVSEIIALQKQARALNAQLLTTEKDMVKIKPFRAMLEPQAPIPEALPVQLSLSEAADFEALVLAALVKARTGRAKKSARLGPSRLPHTP